MRFDFEGGAGILFINLFDGVLFVCEISLPEQRQKKTENK